MSNPYLNWDQERGHKNMKNKMIYLASPHTHTSSGVRQDRYEAALKATSYLIEHGNYFVFSPIVHSHNLPMNTGKTVSWEYWKAFDTETIIRMDEVWVLVIPGTWESKGVKEEIRIAMTLGRRVMAAVPMLSADNEAFMNSSYYVKVVPLTDEMPAGYLDYEKTSGV